MAADGLRVEISGDGVKVVTLDRPEKRNALTPTMLDGLRDEAAEPRGDWRVLLVRGAGKVFCSGFDLDLCRDDGPDQDVMRGFLRGLSSAVWAMRRQHRPVVVAAHGAAIAGGCALLGGADVVVSDRGAKLGYPVVRLGISPAVSAPFLREGVTDGWARKRLLDSELCTGADAYRHGLVHELTETPEEACEAAAKTAAGLAGKPPKALKAAKGWLWMVGEGDALAGQASRALSVSSSLVDGEEAIERLASLWKKDA